MLLGGAGGVERVVRLARCVGEAVRASGLDGVVDVVESTRAVGVLIDPLRVGLAEAESAVREAAARAWAAEEGSGGAGGGASAGGGREVVVPVCYEEPYGLDVGEVAGLTGLSGAEVVRRHAAGRYVAECVGFMPGFAYLGSLEAGLRVGRRAEPRAWVPAGSVGIAGRRTGVYPQRTPGGWRIVGRTPIRLFDAEAERPAVIGVGDAVRFEAIGAGRFEELAAAAAEGVGGPDRRSEGAGGGGRLEVLDGGLLTTVRDLGRVGCAWMGVAVSGPADELSFRIARRLVGGDDVDGLGGGDVGEGCAGGEGMAMLEFGLRGPTVRLERGGLVCLTGARAAEAEVEEGGVRRPLARYRATPIGPGAVVRVGAVAEGVWGYLAFAGGVRTRTVMGSRSEHVPSGVGPMGRALAAGDELVVGAGWSGGVRVPAVGEAAVRRAEAIVQRDVVRAVAVGGDGGGGREALGGLVVDEWEVEGRSDRTGVRLRRIGGEESGWGDGEGRRVDGEVDWALAEDSAPMVAGAVQVPRGGRAVMLGPDGPTVGGYATPMVVAGADLGAVAQRRAGERVRFEAATVAAAVTGLREMRAVVEMFEGPGRFGEGGWLR